VVVKRHAEQVALDCSVQMSNSGEPFLTLNAQHFPSWPNVHFGLRFRPGSTPERICMTIRAISSRDDITLSRQAQRSLYT
jgi:hypothetical protein